MERNRIKLTEQQQKLVEKNINLAYKYASHFANSFGSRHEIDDIISICLLALCKAARSYVYSDGAFSTYAYKAMKHDLYDEYTNKDGYQEYANAKYAKHERDTTPPSIYNWTIHEIIKHAIDMKIIGYREYMMLLLRFDENLTYNDIGIQCDMSASNVNRIIKRALAKMRTNDLFIQDIT